MIVYEINERLWYKTTCSEGKVEVLTVNEFWSCFFQFYRKARLTCPLYRSTEDICRGINFILTCFQHVTHVEKSLSMQLHLVQFIGKQRRFELKSVGNFVAKTVLVESANQFSLEELCRTHYSLKYFRNHIVRPSGKTLRFEFWRHFST